ncbi:hypothetical protein ACR0ST_03735 [Aliidiomarina sp. Khilg15.8]
MRHSSFLVLPLAATALILLSGCLGSSSSSTPAPSEANFNVTASGLAGLTVVSFSQHNGEVWAATDDGIYHTSDQGTSWQQRGLQGLHVQSLVSFDAQQFYALTIDAESNETTALYESLDGGESWQAIESEFEQPEVLYADTTNDYLYAAGQRAVAQSLDRGRSWELIDGEWGIIARTSALVINDINQQLWHGGQGSIENHYLRRLNLSTGAVMQWDNIFPNPATIKSIQFSPTDPDTTIVTGEGGIAIQRGPNANWETPLGNVDYRFYWDLIIDPEAPDHWFTAGWRKGDAAQPFILQYSTNNGQSWQRYTHEPDDHPYGVRSMLLLDQRENGNRVFLIGVSGGLEVGGGVLRVSVDLP